MISYWEDKSGKREGQRNVKKNKFKGVKILNYCKINEKYNV